MAKLNTVTGGTATFLKEFATLLCPVDKQPTRHTQQRVLAHWPKSRTARWQILVKCEKCRLVHLWKTNEIPEGSQLYQVRVHAQGGLIPELGKELPTLEEEFMVLAKSRQGAYLQSQFSSTIPTGGQLTETYIDGEVERDARF
ncbi:hypothetical protein D0N36_03395 [Hymenobacter lapidiphilus]|uniref:hypothetical protein n=1 Tax=Hymenobacter sp. CCM 8763 TaxID=2303334 RepID=UPI000E352277|nr:hypothetical protein [Hymenobacter sp. CCM 8763]RFP66406.1 hypothetical protein D0N36_03395 [Hymenobacter sp. CCM 8763]